MSGPTPATGDTKVMDWVEQQALGDGIDSIVGEVNKTPYQQQTTNPEGRVYDIQTLLDICAATDLSNIHLRIHQGALHGMSKIPLPSQLFLSRCTVCLAFKPILSVSPPLFCSHILFILRISPSTPCI